MFAEKDVRKTRPNLYQRPGLKWVALYITCLLMVWLRRVRFEKSTMTSRPRLVRHG